MATMGRTKFGPGLIFPDRKQSKLGRVCMRMGSAEKRPLHCTLLPCGDFEHQVLCINNRGWSAIVLS